MIMNHLPELSVKVVCDYSAICSVNAGCDAIYAVCEPDGAKFSVLGVDLNRAAGLVKYIHEKKRKFYIQIDSFPTEKDFIYVFEFLEWASDNKVDAVAVNDLGIVYLLRKYFPELDIHIGQIHSALNYADAQTLCETGIKRAFLSRELNFEELEQIASFKPQMELGVELYGENCIDSSNNCFSLLQDKQSGKCCGLCRVLWSCADESGFFLSCKDNNNFDYLEKLSKLGFNSYRISGYGSRSDIIYRLVSSLRMLIDSLDTPVYEKLKVQVESELSLSPLRDSSPAFIGSNPEEVIGKFVSAGQGRFIGTVAASTNFECEIYASADLKLSKGDVLRVYDLNRNIQSDITIQDSKIEFAKGMRIEIKTSKYVPPDSLVYLYSLSGWDMAPVQSELQWIYEFRKNEKIKQVSIPRENLIRRHNFKTETAASGRADTDITQTQACAAPAVGVKFTNAGWDFLSGDSRVDELIFQLDYENLKETGRIIKKWGQISPKIIIEFPDFIFQADMAEYKKAVGELLEGGFRRFRLNSLGATELFKGLDGIELSAGTGLNCLNKFACSFVQAQGFKSVVYPYSGDYTNFQKLCVGNQGSFFSVCLFFFPQMAKTRADFTKVIPYGSKITCHDDRRYTVHRQNKISVILADTPYSITSLKSKLELFNPKSFVLDFSFVAPSRDIFEKIYERLLNSLPLENASSYNFRLSNR